MTWLWDSFWDWGDDYVFKKTAPASLAKPTCRRHRSWRRAVTTGKYVYAWASNQNPGTGMLDNVTLSV